MVYQFSRMFTIGYDTGIFCAYEQCMMRLAVMECVHIDARVLHLRDGDDIHRLTTQDSFVDTSFGTYV